MREPRHAISSAGPWREGRTETSESAECIHTFAERFRRHLGFAFVIIEFHRNAPGGYSTTADNGASTNGAGFPDQLYLLHFTGGLTELCNEGGYENMYSIRVRPTEECDGP